MLPTFIGIGAHKAGTTWLFKCLQDHPQIFMAAVKETNFFHFESIEGRWKEYEQHFVGSDGYRAVGEFSTRYLTSPRAPARIRQYLPEARLVVSLRNPLDQVYSYYWHLQRQNFHQSDRRRVPRSFEQALEQYEELLLTPSYYYRHFQPWLQLFPREQLHVIFYEDIRQKPLDVLQALYAYIGVDPGFVPPSLHEAGTGTRVGTSPRSPLLGRLHAFVYEQLNVRIYYPLKLAIGPDTANRVKEALRVRPVMERLFLRRGYPAMKSRTRAWLRERLGGDVQALASATGRDLSHWR